MQRYRKLIPYILRQWPSLVLILALTAVTSAGAAVQPWPIKLLVDYGLSGMPLPDSLEEILHALRLGLTPTILIVVAALSSLGLFVLTSALDMVLSWTWTAAGQRMVFDLAGDLFHRLQRLSFVYHTRRGIADSLSRVSGDTYCVYSIAHGLLVSPAHHLLTIGSLGVVAWHLDSELTVLALVVAPALGASALYFGDRLKRWTLLSREAETRLLSFVHQTLTAIPIVQAFATVGRNRRQFQALARDTVAVSQRGNLFSNVYGLVNGLTLTIGTAIVLYAGGVEVLSGGLSVGDLLVFVAYLRSWHDATQELLRTYGNLRSVEASLDRVSEVLETQEEVRERPGAKSLPPLTSARGRHVRLENVTFGYEPGRPVLRGVTLEARAGEVVGIVGPTGAGKSSLVSLIPRFFDPWEGRVLMDGVDVRDARLSSVRAQVAIVLQDPFLMPQSVAENIAYGKPGASQKEIEAVARVARADDFIRALPQGYDAMIGERGATLSGGERKRLSIARALLRDAPILILDEPTSALDAGTEALFVEALETLMSGRTTFIIAHRLSTIRRADRIVVVDEGRVVEVGTHEALLRKQGLYYSLHTQQFAAVAKEGAA
jgi:ATP-binding cassette subfamily B protein/subfamily B ATP-binding cassette protein MsbA